MLLVAHGADRHVLGFLNLSALQGNTAFTFDTDCSVQLPVTIVPFAVALFAVVFDTASRLVVATAAVSLVATTATSVVDFTDFTPKMFLHKFLIEASNTGTYDVVVPTFVFQ